MKLFNIMVIHGVHYPIHNLIYDLICCLTYNLMYYPIHYLTYYLMLLGGVKLYAENLGEFLRGDKIENSPYEVRTEKVRVYCVCIFFDKR